MLLKNNKKKLFVFWNHYEKHKRHTRCSSVIKTIGRYTINKNVASFEQTSIINNIQDSGQLNTRLAVWDNRAASKCTLQMNRIAGSGAGRGVEGGKCN